MPVQDSNVLKSFFNAGDVPTESNYIDLIDTMFGLSGSHGDTILLYHVNGDPLTEYPSTDAGLTDALDEASEGDVVLLPACSIEGEHTVPVDVTLIGFGMGSVLTGDVICNGHLLNLQCVEAVTLGENGSYHIFNTTGDLTVSGNLSLGGDPTDDLKQKQTIVAGGPYEE